MRNDDSNYVQQLERALEAAELEIKGLENELREQDEALRLMQEQLAPTHMGEPVLVGVTATQAFATTKSLEVQLAQVKKERDECKANSDRYELLRDMKLYEMQQYNCLPCALEDSYDWFDEQTDAKIRERYPRAIIGDLNVCPKCGGQQRRNRRMCDER